MSDQFVKFLNGTEKYGMRPKSSLRLQARWARVVEPLIGSIKGKSVLDLGAHDGRWAYAYALAGASCVTGVEYRTSLVEEFDSFSDAEIRSKIRMVNSDIFSFLECAVKNGESFDIVLVLGYFYHTIEHFRLLSLIKELAPEKVVIDSEFLNVSNPVIQILTEKTNNDLNCAPQYVDQELAVVGVPSIAAMEKFSMSLDFDLVWFEKNKFELEPHDYRRRTRKIRKTCFLTPKQKYY